MLSLLGGLAESIGHWVQHVLVVVANMLIAAFATAAAALLSLCPSMPAPPSVPVASWVGWLNWLIPVGPMIAGLGVFVGLWTAFLVVRIPLRWVKAL